MEKTHDSQGRRLRFTSQSTGERIYLNERDLVLCEKLHRHGPLTANFLFKYDEHQGRGLSGSQKRLTQLANEDDNEVGGKLLTKPDAQQRTARAENKYITYDISVYGESLLKNKGRWTDYALPPLVRSNSFEHDYMASAIMASIELACLRDPNVNYIFADRILERANANMHFTVQVEGHASALKPDGLFGLEYLVDEQKRYRFFVIEADRSTERLRKGAAAKKSYAYRIQQYRDFIAHAKYKDALGLTAGLMVLNLTNTVARKETMLEITGELAERGVNTYMLYRAAPHFTMWHDPSHIMYELFSEPWERAGAKPFYISTVDGPPAHVSV